MTETELIKQLWRTIFEQERIAHRLVEVFSEKNGITSSLEIYGTVRLLVKPATAIGDNYMSDTFYITAVLNSGVEHRAFVKVLPGNPMMRAAAGRLQVYRREIGSYCHLFPLLRQIRDQAGLTHEDLPLSVPEIYYTNLDETKENDEESSTVVVMEELSSQGFAMIDKHVGCSTAESKLALTALANFHALTFMLLKRYQNIDGSYSLPPSIDFLFAEEGLETMISNCVTANLPLYIKMIRHFGHEKAGDWLEKQTDRVAEIYSTKVISECGPLALICHGDFWNNNILFRHDQTTGKVNDVRLVDWQLATVQTPGTDVHHFLKTSTTPKVRKENGQQLVDHYVTAFLSVLERLGVPLKEQGLDRHFVMVELNKKLLHGVFVGLTYLPGMLEGKMTEKLEEMSKNEVNVTNIADNEVGETESNPYGISPELLLANEPLCDRIIYLVEEVREALELL